MARPIRIEYSGAWYHITSRGNERREIFKGDADRQKFFKILASSMALYNVHLHAYVLMNNHFHLVVNTLEANLQKFMQRFSTAYTVYYNRKHNRSGHLYQGRYKAILIDADNYLLELSRYVHLNPMKIKRVSSYSIEEKADIIRKYEWSSYAGYVSLRRRQPFVHYEKVLGMLTGRDDGKGRKVYAQFVLEGMAKKKKMSMWEEVRGQAVLGSERFNDYIQDRFLTGMKIDPKEQSGIGEVGRKAKSVEEVAAVVAKAYTIKEAAALYVRRSNHREARSVFIELCRRYLSRKISIAELGRRIGNVSGAAIWINSKRLAAAMEQHKELRQQFELLEKELQRSIVDS